MLLVPGLQSPVLGLCWSPVFSRVEVARRTVDRGLRTYLYGNILFNLGASPGDTSRVPRIWRLDFVVLLVRM